jgi:hypothetical protein
MRATTQAHGKQFGTKSKEAKKQKIASKKNQQKLLKNGIHQQQEMSFVSATVAI